MKDRIKKLRKFKGMTQSEFGECIGVRGNTITTYENGTRTPSEAVIVSICREFGVNEDWLRNGTEPMFLEKSRDEELSAFFGDLLSGQPDFKRRLISVLSRLDAEEWALLEQMADKLVEEMEKEKADS